MAHYFSSDGLGLPSPGEQGGRKGSLQRREQSSSSILGKGKENGVGGETYREKVTGFMWNWYSPVFKQLSSNEVKVQHTSKHWEYLGTSARMLAYKLNYIHLVLVHF